MKLRFQLIAVCLAVLIAFGSGYLVAPYMRHGVNRVHANVFISENTGGVVSELAAGNVITNDGEAYVRDVLSVAGTYNSTKYITVSNDASPAASWNRLANEVVGTGFDRVAGTVTSGTNGSGDSYYNVTTTFTASGAGATLQCAGLHWQALASSYGNLFAAAAFTQTTFAAGDTLTITWMITVDAN